MNNILHFFKRNLSNIFTLAVCITVAMLPEIANASSTGMPYEGALEKLKNSLTGPVAQTVAIVGIVASGATLIFGGEISGFLKSVIYLILVCSLLIAGTKIISVFSDSSSGATIAVVSVSADNGMVDSTSNS